MVKRCIKRKGTVRKAPTKFKATTKKGITRLSGSVAVVSRTGSKRASGIHYKRHFYTPKSHLKKGIAYSNTKLRLGTGKITYVRPKSQPLYSKRMSRLNK